LYASQVKTFLRKLQPSSSEQKIRHKIDEGGFFEIFIHIYQTTGHHIPEDNNLNDHIVRTSNLTLEVLILWNIEMHCASY
jgi:hypothetical protein